MITTDFNEDRELGELIREHRKRHNMTQRDLAGWIGCSAPHLHDIECGKRALQLRHATALSGILDHDFIMELLVRVIPEGYTVTKDQP